MGTGILEGRVAVVTGAARGLGQAVALALGGAGARVALVDLAPQDGTLAAARERGIEAEAYAVDVASEPAVEALAAVVRARFGAAHIVVNAAGVIIRKRITELTLSEWNHVLAVNLTGVFLVSRAMVPLMRGHGYGRILNFASVMGHISTPDRPAYSTTKSGVLGLTRALAADLADEGITAVAISPGAFATELTAPLRADPAINAGLMSRIPARRWGTPEEIGELAVFLCSGGGAYISGTDILIDGGWLST